MHQNQTAVDVGFSLTLVNTFVEEWSLSFSYNSRATVSDSIIDRIWVGYHETIAKIESIYSGFHQSWTLNNINLQNTSVGHWVLDICDSSLEIIDTEAYVIASGTSNISITESNKLVLHTATHYFGTLFLNQSLLEVCEGFVDSDFYIHGKIDQIGLTRFWISTDITRNYNVIATDISDNPMENVELALSNGNDTVVWDGTTDNLGKANFNLTFTDNNYTDTLRLEAVKGNYSATMNVSFLSDTPVALTMRYFTDLNADGTINIVDISIVAMAFGTRGGDPNYDSIADLDDNNQINIVDVSIVALDYGKTV